MINNTTIELKDNPIMDEIGAFDAKNKFSALLDKVERGEEITITRRGRVVAILGPPTRGHDVERARAAMRRIRERAKKFGGPFDWEEWKRYRDEGRR
jgi:antitoxin (DNA-binding transcriptional repressor) of toxin-antitoxin stability system